MLDETLILPETTDYDHLLRNNLERVFNERDAVKRAQALEELFCVDPVMYEPIDVVRGRDAISDTAGKLLEQFGSTFRFVPDGVAVGHHGMGSLRWYAGPEGEPAAITGSDVAQIVDGKIAHLWVMLDPSVT